MKRLVVFPGDPIGEGVLGKRKFDLNAYINVYWRFRN